MKRFSSIRLPLMIAGALAWWTPTEAAPDLTERVEMLTTSPLDCFDPVVSPDGRWLVFTCDDGGNMNLFARRLDRARSEAPINIAPSAAEDSAPAFDPRGRWLAFVSNREDAFGDVWVMRFPNGDPILVSERGRRDRAPQWTGTSRNPRLLFESEDPDGSWGLYAAEPGSWRASRVDEDARPQAPAGPRLILQYADDTSGDGETGAQSGDHPSVWETDPSTRLFRQLTPPIEGIDGAVRDRDGNLVFTANVRGTLDIVRVRNPWPVATVGGAREAHEQAVRQWRDFPQRPFEAVALARQAYLLDPESASGRRGLILALDVLRAIDRPEQALLTLRQASRGVDRGSAFGLEIAWRAEVLDVERALRDGTPLGEVARLREQAAERLEALRGEANTTPELHAILSLEAARQRVALRQPQRALALIESSQAVEDMPAESLGRLALERGRIYRALFPDQAPEVLLAVLQAYPSYTDLQEETAEELVEAVMDRGTTNDERIIALRTFDATDHGNIAATAATRLAEGRLLDLQGRVGEARSAWTRAQSYSDHAPRLAALAAFDFAAQLARFGEFEESIRVYEGVEEDLRERLFAGVPQFIADAREGRIRDFLAKGNEELRLGDAPLARRTFRQLLDREPQLVEGWRGLIEAEYRMGMIDRAYRRRYQREAASNPDDALSQYKYGLVLTYQDRMPSRARRQLETAIALDATVPYFHQTLGFYFEAEGRRQSRTQYAADALREYQRALSLVDAQARPLDHARLLVNTANAALTLGQYARAADLYGQRLETGLPFDDPRTEFLAHRSNGIALFRANRPSPAVTAFGDARDTLGVVRERRFPDLTDDVIDDIDTELLDRQALALMDSGFLRDAALAFGEVARRSEPNSINEARAKRNEAFSLLRLSERRDNVEAERFRRESERAFERALEILESPDFTAASRERTGGALFTFEVTIAADPLGGADIDLSREDEIRLARTALTRIRLRDADPRAAVEDLERQLQTQPGDSEGNRAYFQTIRLITLDQLARQYAILGEIDSASSRLARAIDHTRIEEGGVEIINGGALSHLLLHMTELVMQSDEVPEGLRELRGSWIADGIEPAGAEDFLDQVLVRALSLRIADRPDYLLDRPVLRARLMLARTLLAERMVDSHEEAQGIADLRSGTDAVRAIRLAEATGQLARELGTDAEARRLALLATASSLRVSIRFESPEQYAQRRSEALALAERWGYPGLRWWFESQGTLSHDPAVALAAAQRTLGELDALPPGPFSEQFDRPLELMRHVESLLVASHLNASNYSAALYTAERMRAARLRLVFGSVILSPAPDDEADARWLREYETLRTTYVRSLVRLRELPAEEPHQVLVARSRDAATRLRNHVTAGRNANLASAVMISPRAIEVANPGAALADGLALANEPGVLLSSPGGWVAWRDGQARVLRSADEWNDESAQAPLWFVLGNRPRTTADTAEVVHLLTFESAILAQENLRIATAIDDMVWPEEDAAAARVLGDFPREEIALRRAFALSASVRPTGRNPLLWQMENVDASLGSVLGITPSLDQFSARIRNDIRSPLHMESDEELLAALASHRGTAEATINDSAWISRMLRPREAPDLARAELDASVGAVIDRIDAGDLRGALEPTRRTYYLRRALEMPRADVTEAGTLLAQIQGDLRRYRESASTMAGVVAEHREAGDEASLASALLLLGSYQNDAQQYDAALDSYAEAAELLASQGDPRALNARAQIGVVLENSGRYPEALGAYREVLGEQESAGDIDGVIEQWSRIGRVYLLRQNIYPSAESAFGEALRIARDNDRIEAEILATLDLARVDERLGRYDAAVAKADAMQAEADRIGDNLLKLDALLVAAFVEWARADYFEAFRLARLGLDMSDEIDDAPFRIIARNTLGLVYWAVNDTDSALAEFNRAIALAEDQGLAREAASGLNNRALVYRSLREFERAFNDLEAARRIDERQQNTWGVAYVLRNTGLTELQRGAHDRALAPLERSAVLAGEIGDRTNRAKALLGIGDAHLYLADYRSAITRYDEALAEARAIPLPEVEWRALHGLAVIARSEGEVARARGLFEESLRVIEQLRSRIRIEEFQDGFLLDKQEVYDDLIALLLQDGEVVEAFNVSERSRARNFVDLLGNARLRGRSADDERDLQRERELRAELEAARAALGAAAETQRERMSEVVDERTRDYTNFLIELRSRNPQLSSFVSVETLDLAGAQSLLDSGTALIQYHVMQDSLAVWVVTSDAVRFNRVRIGRPELERLILAFRTDLQNFARVEEELLALSAVVWEPVAPLIPSGVNRLAIVPHRETHLVPFAAMRTGNASLIDRYSLYHSPSASVLEYTKGRRGITRVDNPRVLAFGNPDRNDPAMDLPFAQKEAERISWTYGDAEVRTRSDASLDWLTQNIGGFNIVHLATHGEFDAELPLMSSLMLAPDSGNDGLLTAQDIFSLSMNADLVALSACQTGLGRLSNGDDVIGLNRSFVYAGTRQILSSLWRVDDVSTAVMIKHFYRNINDADRAEALRRAMLEVRERYPHPAHWSGMVLTGDWM